MKDWKVVALLVFGIVCSMMIGIIAFSLSLIAVNRAYNPPDPEPPWRALRAPACQERKP